ncbi:MAG: hypothetical protein AAGA48_11085 [Myxococcota bacterium]
MRTLPFPLVEAVVDSDDDAAARFVLADWLSEQGDPQGEWLMSCLQEPPDPERFERVQRAVHRALFAGWPGQHAIVTWRRGFVRGLVVRLPGVSRTQIEHALSHPAMWLVESVTFTAACLPLFEIGLYDQLVAALRASGPHRRLRQLRFAGPSLQGDPEETRETLRAGAPSLDAVIVEPRLDPSATEWFECADRLDLRHAAGAPGPFSPAPAQVDRSLDAQDEEALWLEHADWCDLRDDESDGRW